MAVRPVDGDGVVVLPAGYVAEQVELGYAATVFSSQGRTVTTAHAVVGVSMTREALYVAATRGRESNRLYVDLEPEPTEASHGKAERPSARQVLISVAHRRGAETSAHQMIASEWASAESLGQLVAEHESLVAVAGSERWEKALAGAGLAKDVLASARRSPEWDDLVSLLTSAEGRGLPVGATLPRLARLLPAGEGPAVALQAVLLRWEETNGVPPRPRPMVAGLVPRARGIEDDDLARAVREREQLITRRAQELAEEAVHGGKKWARPFGPPPKGPTVAEAWWDHLAVIAAYRERWNVSGPGILGEEPSSLRQAIHRERARRAGEEAAVSAGVLAPRPLVPSTWTAPGVQVERGVDL